MYVKHQGTHGLPLRVNARLILTITHWQTQSNVVAESDILWSGYRYSQLVEVIKDLLHSSRLVKATGKTYNLVSDLVSLFYSVIGSDFSPVVNDIHNAYNLQRQRGNVLSQTRAKVDVWLTAVRGVA